MSGKLYFDRDTDYSVETFIRIGPTFIDPVAISSTEGVRKCTSLQAMCISKLHLLRLGQQDQGPTKYIFQTMFLLQSNN